MFPLFLAGLLSLFPVASARAHDVSAKRAALMQNAENLLAAGKADAAADAFERAGYMQHSADAEIGLVRSYMQAGKYRQAISYIAHTAGVHDDEPEGLALYAVLLHAGGQSSAARRLLASATPAARRSPALMQAGCMLLSNPAMHCSTPGNKLFGPYSLPGDEKIDGVLAASGTVADGGWRALVPADAVAGARRIWVRNGLGEVRRATVESRSGVAGLAILRLHRPLTMPAGLRLSEKTAFPGSVAYVAAYSPSSHGHAAWPLLVPGFLGSPDEQGKAQALGIDIGHASAGGPVFDATGALAGIALNGKAGEGLFVPVRQLGRHFGSHASATPAAVSLQASHTRLPMDAIYEVALQSSLQVIVGH